MNKLKLCNVHKLALSNEGEGRKPIHIPFGTWAYDDTIDQTLDREHADAIAADLAGKIAAGEPGIPVYQGHPDVPEYAGKYPDKGALGWVKKILVNEDGMDLEVEWDRDPGKGFGWFSPYWTGDDPGPGATGKRNVIVDGLTSIGLVNNPNIREFRLANEAGENLTQRRGEAEVAAFKMPQHLIDLAKRFDDRVALANVIDANGVGHSDENGQFDGSGTGGGGGSSQSARLDRMLGEARNGIAKAKEKVAASKARQSAAGKERAELESRLSEIRKKRTELKDFNDKMEARLKGGGSGGGGGKPKGLEYKDSKGQLNSVEHDYTNMLKSGRAVMARNTPRAEKAKILNGLMNDTRKGRGDFAEDLFGPASDDDKTRHRRAGRATVKALHVAAIEGGLKYNRATHQYE